MAEVPHPSALRPAQSTGLFFLALVLLQLRESTRYGGESGSLTHAGPHGRKGFHYGGTGMLLVFKIVYLTIIGFFVVAISDLRRRERAIPIISTKVSSLTKIFYPIPMLVWIYAIARAGAISPTDWLSLVIAIPGIALTVRGKWDIGECHAWAGYFRTDTPKICWGAYRFLNHPMYTGIVLVIIAAASFTGPRLSRWPLVAFLSVNSWIGSFLIVVARRETAMFRENPYGIAEIKGSGT